MCCFFLVLTFLGPRVGTIIWWIVQPGRFDSLFNSIIIPILGIIFLPWTTLMYVAVGFNGITGFEWVFLGLGLFVDIASYGGAFKQID